MGIGLSGPDASFVLDISGDIQFRGDISGSGAKLYNIPNEALDNSMITINGMDVSLGGSLEFIASQWTDGSYSDSSFIIYNSGTVGIGNGISGPDASFALDVSGIVNCMELLIDGKAPIFGSDNIKLYDIEIGLSNEIVKPIDTVRWKIGQGNNENDLLFFTDGHVEFD